MSIGKYILIDPSECPTREELVDGIERLYKCCEILTQIRRKKDPDPKSLMRVASFLDLLYKDNRLKHNKSSEEEEVILADRIEQAKNKDN